MTRNPDDPRITPREAAEREEREGSERTAAESASRAQRARGEEDDPREEEGWTQPESSAQKGAVRDDG